MHRALLLLLCAAPAWARDGKVVRVERPHVRGGAIRICEISRDASGMCFGERARPDDIIAVVDDQQVFAELRVVEVADQGGRGCDAIWKFRAEVMRGDVSNTSWSRALGVIDARLDRRAAHKLPEDKLPPAPSGNTDERILGAIARGGGPDADIALTQYLCDANGQPTQLGQEQCFRLWSREPGGWKSVHEMLISACFR